MAEAALQFQILRYRPHARRAEAVIELTLLGVPLPHRIQSAFHNQPAQVDRARRLVHEALLAGCVDHQVCGAFVVESLADLIHQVDRVANARGCHIAVGMPSRHHAREILRIQLLAFGNFRAGRRKRRHASIRSARRSLNAGVRVLLVVVANNQAVVIPIECAGNRGEADVGRATVARLADNIREGTLPLALADHRFIGGGDAGGEAACATNLRVRPRHVVRRA